ncbi:MAG: 50S ribosomal protein L20 [Phycisphaerae bacterium]
MPRTTSAVPRHKRIKRTLKAARGAFMTRSKTFHSANETLIRAGNYARADRRARKNEYRSLWITRLSGACLSEGIAYSRLIHGLRLAEIKLNRKMLSEIALHDPVAFSAIVEQAKAQLVPA